MPPHMRRKRKPTPHSCTSSCPYTVYKSDTSKRGLVMANILFPDTIVHDDGETDDVCRFCFEWCTTRGSRYHLIQGDFVGTAPLSYERDNLEYDYPDTVPICDGCYKSLDLPKYVPKMDGLATGDKDTPLMRVLGCYFRVETLIRTND